jgi:glucose-6-phosphate isomerase
LKTSSANALNYSTTLDFPRQVYKPGNISSFRNTELSQSYYNQDISAGVLGLDMAKYQTYLDLGDKALVSLKALYDSNSLPLLELPEKTSDLEAIEPIAERFCENFDDVIILGTGGSSLGGQTLCALAVPSASTRPNLHFMDNIDPHSFDLLFRGITPERTGFIVISKSGGTAETLAQFLYCLDVFRSQKISENSALNIENHFLIITEPGDRPLRRLAEKWKIEIIDYDPGIGGRYSALAIPSLLPSLIAGVNAYEIRKGATKVLKQMASANTVDECPPALGAILNVALAKENNINTTVLMPYLDRLNCFGSWFQQLWAESLGKNGKGTTPIRALGVVDQHSQLQLYLDGPKDKLITLLIANQNNKGGLIPKDLTDDPELKFIADKRMGDLMAAEQRATAATLIKNNCPTRIIKINSLDERSLGSLLMHFMLETIIAADLLGLNAFNQPAVEEGKAMAKQYLISEGN